MKDLAVRTREFAILVIRLCAEIPRTLVGQVLGKQLLRCGTSVGTHYREAVRARSDAEFISKVEGALQELDGTRDWFELPRNADVIPAGRLVDIDSEADELIAIFVAVVKKRKAAMKR